MSPLDDYQTKVNRELAAREKDVEWIFQMWRDVGLQDARNREGKQQLRRTNVPDEGLLGYHCGYDDGLASIADFNTAKKLDIAGRIAAALAVSGNPPGVAASRALAIASEILDKCKR